MDFQPLTPRLNYFFPENSWALLTKDTDSGLDVHFLNPLKITCKHWGASLEFPIEMPSEAFENTSEVLQYWHQKLPGIRLLHHRKQHILAHELLQGYQTVNASELFRKKLRLSPDNWGYLLYFGGLKRSFFVGFPQKPSAKTLSDSVVQYYTQFGVERQHDAAPHDALNSSEREWVARFEHELGLRPSMANILWMAAKYHRKGVIRHIQATLLQEPDRITVNPMDASIQFHEMQVKVKLPPLPFAIYCMYLEQESGFYNKERFSFQSRALFWYRRVRTFRDLEEAERLLKPCFNPADDKPFRDAVRTIKRLITEALNDETLAKHYIITGKNGGMKRITIDRSLVQIC